MADKLRARLSRRVGALSDCPDLARLPGDAHETLAALDAHRTAGGTCETGFAPLIREAADRQTQALLQNREPEAAFTEVAAQEEILRIRQARTGHDGTLESSIRAALAYKRRGAPEPAPAPAARLARAS
ncbi:hypothetical protein ACWCQE_40130 [Streptomyces sp. NPDC002409]